MKWLNFGGADVILSAINDRLSCDFSISQHNGNHRLKFCQCIYTLWWMFYGEIYFVEFYEMTCDYF